MKTVHFVPKDLTKLMNELLQNINFAQYSVLWWIPKTFQRILQFSSLSRVPCLHEQRKEKRIEGNIIKTGRQGLHRRTPI